VPREPNLENFSIEFPTDGWVEIRTVPRSELPDPFVEGYFNGDEFKSVLYNSKTCGAIGFNYFLFGHKFDRITIENQAREWAKDSEDNKFSRVFYPQRINPIYNRRPDAIAIEAVHQSEPFYVFEPNIGNPNLRTDFERKFQRITRRGFSFKNKVTFFYKTSTGGCEVIDLLFMSYSDQQNGDLYLNLNTFNKVFMSLKLPISTYVP
jgi:hypothetical protein